MYIEENTLIYTKKNSFVEVSKNLCLDTNLKIILLASK